MLLVPKLSAKSLGFDRNTIGTMLKTTALADKIQMGLIVGIVTGFRETVDAETGDVQRGLKGSFKGVSTLADKDGVIIEARSGVCYLPSGIQDMIEAALITAREADVASMPTPADGKAKPESRATITFAIKLFAVHATNKAGYSFDAETLQEPSESDPLDALIALATTPQVPASQLPAPGAPAPETPKAKGKQDADKVPA